jgi:hypothetical protein
VSRKSKRTLTRCMLFLGGPGLLSAATPERMQPEMKQGGATGRIKHVFVIVLENEGYNTTFGGNSPAPLGPYTLNYQSFGGDLTGAVLLSPYLTPGTVSNTLFHHYSLLRTIEDIFNLNYPGYASQPGMAGFFGCITSDIRTSDSNQFSQCTK